MVATLDTFYVCNKNQGEAADTLPRCLAARTCVCIAGAMERRILTKTVQSAVLLSGFYLNGPATCALGGDK